MVYISLWPVQVVFAFISHNTFDAKENDDNVYSTDKAIRRLVGYLLHVATSYIINL